MAQPIKHILKAVNSKPDSSGNRYWGFVFYDVESEKTVTASISGGESNIYGILRHWNNPDGWDYSIHFEREEMKIRDFDRKFKRGVAPYAGCNSEDLAQFIKNALEAEK